MKKAFLAVALSLSLAAAARADIIISEVYPSGSSNGTYAADWFELTNTGPSAVDITGWKVDDNSKAFASAVAITNITSIAAGQSVVFVEHNTAGTNFTTISDAFQLAWFGVNPKPGFAIGGYGGSGIGLGSGGDELHIYDSTGTEITFVTFGATTTGFTFDNAAGLNGKDISQLSVVGVNGAFTSFNGAEVGSPGTIGTAAVPEPSSMALIGLAIGGAGLRALRRRARPTGATV